MNYNESWTGISFIQKYISRQALEEKKLRCALTTVILNVCIKFLYCFMYVIGGVVLYMYNRWD